MVCLTNIPCAHLPFGEGFILANITTKIINWFSIHSTMTSLLMTIRSFLDQHGISYVIKEHPSVTTSEEAAAARGESLKIGAKALLVKDDTHFVLLVIPADRKLDTKKVKKVLNTRNLRFASPEELKEIAHVEKGAVPPFGNLLGIEMIVDTRLFEEEYMAFNAGSVETSIKMKTEDYRIAVKPREEDIASINV